MIATASRFGSTLENLQEQKRELEDRLADGDLTAEAALERIDRAIASRTKTINHSRKRLQAVKAAVAKGVPLEDTRPTKVSARAKKNRTTRNKGPINRF